MTDAFIEIQEELKYLMRMKDSLPINEINVVITMISELHKTVKRISDGTVSLFDKKCKHCNETHPKYFGKSSKTICTQCSSRKNYDEKIKPSIEKGKERNMITKLEKGNCHDCNLNVTKETISMFEWDHRNPCEKECQISKMNMRKDDVYYIEIQKCDLVCSNCHSLRTKKHFEDNLISKRQNNKQKKSAAKKI